MMHHLGGYSSPLINNERLNETHLTDVSIEEIEAIAKSVQIDGRIQQKSNNEMDNELISSTNSSLLNF